MLSEEDRWMNELRESELRALLTDLVLREYGLTAAPPPPPTVKRTQHETKPSMARQDARFGSRATFTAHSAPRPSGFRTEPSAIPGRSRPLVGKTRTLRDTGRGTPGKQEALVNREATPRTVGRVPGESDRDYIHRRNRIASARRGGYAQPRTDEATLKSMLWEMGH